MDDMKIIGLYWSRDESAIQESQRKYGRYCAAVASNILRLFQDVEECVNDTWFRAWNTIPPQKPCKLSLFFGKITRNLAIDRLRRDNSSKRGGSQVSLCLDELGECIGEEQPIADRLALKELLETFLSGLSDENREAFLLRYWYFMPVSNIASRQSKSVGAVKMALSRVRKDLRHFLEKEEVEI